MTVTALAEPPDDLEPLRRDVRELRPHVTQMVEILRLERLLNP